MATRLKQVREERGLSQHAVARQAGIHPSTLSRLEAGKMYAYPGWKRRLAVTLGVDEEELFREGDALSEKMGVAE